MTPSIDRLSELPDDVIFHILSFLPTKTSASTNVLAKRWRFLWAHVPTLNFNGDDFAGEARDSDIVHRFIVLHRAKTIETFRLSDVSCNLYQLATWILHAVNRRARNIYLDINIDDVFTLPRCFLTCQTLVDVKLRCCVWIPSDEKVFLPSLKKLHLSRVIYEDGESLPRLISGCPVLEDLIINGCDNDYEDDLDCVFLSSPRLKTLDVHLLKGCHVLKLNTPSLVYLNVKNCCLDEITSLGTMTSLVEADFNLYGGWDVEKHIVYATSVQFLNCLCNLRCLKISNDNAQMVVDIVGLDSMRKFDNLTKLELHLVFDFHKLVKLLEVADNLKHFTFTLGGRHYTYREPKLVPACMLSRLKTVRINPFDDFNAHDFESIRYLLRNAQVLERMEMHSCSYSNSGEEELAMLDPQKAVEKEFEMLLRVMEETEDKQNAADRGLCL